MEDRLRVVADMVPPGGVLADIGTDHGILPELLLKEGRVQKAICCDISEASLSKARRRLAGHPNAEFRCGDGLAALKPGEADIIVMTGMGGHTIADILRHGKASDDALFILGAHSGLPALRRFLMENGYAIESERVAREKRRYYVIMGVRRGAMILDARQLLMGRFLPEREDAKDYLRHLCHILEKGARYDPKKRAALYRAKEALRENS